MLNRIDQSKDKTPPLDESDRLIPDDGEEPAKESSEFHYPYESSPTRKSTWF